MYWSLRRWCPEAHLYVLALSAEAYANLSEMELANLTLISIGEFEEYDHALYATKCSRSKIEYIFTSTPCLCRYVFAHDATVNLLTYLDADLYFFSDVQPMFDELGTASIGIIEHGYTSARYLMYGRFNVGWISFRRDNQGLACVDWWRARCIEWCKDVVEPGRYADQKYLDCWPKLFSGVHIFEHPGANLARWNIQNRSVTCKDSEVQVNGRPLIFFHFASFRQVATGLFQPNFSTHWVRLDRVVKTEIFGLYIAEIYAISGGGLPRGSRRLISKKFRFGGLINLAFSVSRFVRAILMSDFIFIRNIQSHSLRFCGRITSPISNSLFADRSVEKPPKT